MSAGTWAPARCPRCTGPLAYGIPAVTTARRGRRSCARTEGTSVGGSAMSGADRITGLAREPKPPHDGRDDHRCARVMGIVALGFFLLVAVGAAFVLGVSA